MLDGNKRMIGAKCAFEANVPIMNGFAVYFNDVLFSQVGFYETMISVS